MKLENLGKLTFKRFRHGTTSKSSDWSLATEMPHKQNWFGTRTSREEYEPITMKHNRRLFVTGHFVVKLKFKKNMKIEGIGNNNGASK